jgi:hypothetical protein
MYVDRVETGARERSRHFHLTVDALLAQHGHARTHAAHDVRRGHVA